MDGNYAANPDFAVDTTEPIGTISQPFTGTFDGAYVPLTLTHPLFGYVDGGTVKNVRVSSATISGTDVGAVVCVARGTARIYNCGVLSGTVSGSGTVGGIVGTLAYQSEARVVNCYSYANVTGGTFGGGIVGRNNSWSGGDDSKLRGRIAMCMMYGNLTSGSDANGGSPVYAGGNKAVVGGSTTVNIE